MTPYASRFPFEMWLLPKVHGSSIRKQSEHHVREPRANVKDVLMRMDAALDRPRSTS